MWDLTEIEEVEREGRNILVRRKNSDIWSLYEPETPGRHFAEQAWAALEIAKGKD